MIDQLSSDPTTRDAGGRIHRFASMAHNTIDRLQQSLGSRSEGVMSTPARYGEQARQYGDKLREQINARPLQSAGIAVGTGVVLDKLFSRPPKVRVVKVPVDTTPAWDPSRSADRRAANRWTRAADSRLHAVRGAGQQAVGQLGATADAGLARTRAMASTLTRTAATVPLQMRLATQRLLARSQEYGSMAREGVQAHPLVGAGAFLGVGALLTTLWMQRRRPEYGTAYVTVDDTGDGFASQRVRVDSQPRYREMISDRPVTSAAVVLGVGALIGAMLARR